MSASDSRIHGTWQLTILDRFRLYPGASGASRISPEATTLNDGVHDTPIPAGSQIFCSFFAAGSDPDKYPDPATVKLDRPVESYLPFVSIALGLSSLRAPSFANLENYQGYGPHACLGRAISTTAGAAMLRAFARECPQVRRAPGAQGEMKSKMYMGAIPVFLSEDGGSWGTFAVAKKVIFDASAGGV